MCQPSTLVSISSCRLSLTVTQNPHVTPSLLFPSPEQATAHACAPGSTECPLMMVKGCPHHGLFWMPPAARLRKNDLCPGWATQAPEPSGVVTPLMVPTTLTFELGVCVFRGVAGSLLGKVLECPGQVLYSGSDKGSSLTWWPSCVPWRNSSGDSVIPLFLVLK